MANHTVNAVVEVWPAKDGWRWRARHKNGNIIAESGEGYKSKAQCERMWRRTGVYLMKLATYIPEAWVEPPKKPRVTVKN